MTLSGDKKIIAYRRITCDSHVNHEYEQSDYVLVQGAVRPCSVILIIPVRTSGVAIK